MEYVGGGSVSNLLRNPDTGPVGGEVNSQRERGQDTCWPIPSPLSLPPLSLSPDSPALLQDAPGGPELPPLSGSGPQRHQTLPRLPRHRRDPQTRRICSHQEVKINIPALLAHW